MMPSPVADMLAGYRTLAAERGFDWGDEWLDAAKILMRYVSWLDSDQWIAVQEELGSTGTLRDPVGVLLDSLAEPPQGFALVHAGRVEMRTLLPLALPGHPITYHVLTAGEDGRPASARQAVVSVERPDIEIDGRAIRAVEAVAGGLLRLRSDGISRWTVLDERGGGWFPDDALVKFDWENRPFFHGNDLVVEVPAGPITVSVTRGCEFRARTAVVDVPAREVVEVDLMPERLYDAAARGWYGGDLHVHMNLSGDQVCTPKHAAVMQRGEGLHLMNLLAANFFTAVVYDREAFEHYAGQDLPWNGSDAVASWGVEYRNNLLGHFHALNPSGPPTRYNSGHPRSDEPQDWPPNAVAAAELRDMGATLGYTHPIAVPMGVDGSPDEVFAPHRSALSEARELVADAALGLIDSVDLGAPAHIGGTEYLYHRLLGAGLRLAATAGTDAMLSHSRQWAHSNPPGWFRAYADLGDRPLSVPAWQNAVRNGRTFATNGPWLELDVDGRGLGETLSVAGPQSVPITVRMNGLNVERLEIVGPEGTLAEIEVETGAERAELATTLEIEESTWLAAIARGADHRTLRGTEPLIYAHTSPVWVEVAGRPVARPDDIEWCLDWLDRFELLARKKGTFTSPGQVDDLLAVLDSARTALSKRLLDSV